MKFKDMKKKQLSRKDKSNIGKWDLRIKGLCEKINDMDNYYTTSSCGGRIVLVKGLDKKSEGAFVFRTHKKISFNEIKKALRGVDYNGLVEFKMSCCILHVACACLKDAQKLVDKAKFAGWKRSGIMASGRRFMVELLSTENIEFPVMNNGKILVDDDFLRLVVEGANKKLERSWGKIGKLRKLI